MPGQAFTYTPVLALQPHQPGCELGLVLPCPPAWLPVRLLRGTFPRVLLTWEPERRSAFGNLHPEGVSQHLPIGDGTWQCSQAPYIGLLALMDHSTHLCLQGPPDGPCEKWGGSLLCSSVQQHLPSPYFVPLDVDTRVQVGVGMGNQSGAGFFRRAVQEIQVVPGLHLLVKKPIQVWTQQV